jgi:hypothetical protein
MQIKSFCRAWLFGILLPTATVLAQVGEDKAQLAQLEAQLLSSWWVSVEGERGQRIMRITSIGPRADGHFGVDLNYGILGGGMGPLKGVLYRQSQPSTTNPQEWIGPKTYKLEFATGAGTVISAESTTAGVFVGTFVTRSGRSKPITLERVTEDEIHVRVNGTNAERRAAAQKWLAKDEIKIDYDGPYKSTFTVDMKAKTVMFYGGENDNICTRAPVPAEVRVDGQDMLVFTFDSKLSGCAQLQYTFDPVSRAGTIRQRPPVRSRRNPATRSRHIPATWGGAEGHLEAPC